MADEAPRFAELVALLAEHGVEFIIVGGAAAVLQGASLTTFDLDVLGTIGANTTFEDVAARATRIVLRGHEVDVLSLEDLIAAKSFAHRPKDRAVLPLLRAVLEESRRDPG